MQQQRHHGSPSSLFELPGDQPGALLAIHSKLVCFA
jgi:hypothetical protein